LEHFIKLGIAPEIIEALSAQGYTQPTPIQEQAIPAALAQNDILGTAQTGTGKTAAFSIPIIQQLMGDAGRTKGIKALILTPTRELALQIDESIASYAANVRLKHAVIFGGVGQNPQVDAIKRGVDIMTATPGRLLDLMQQGFIDLRNIQFFVLDEADRMLDMGFIHDVKKVIAKLPTKRQTLFFSDTSVEEIPSVLVFTRTKHGADKVVKDLVKLNMTAQAIHGNKSQNARQLALSNFKSRITRVLVATDIAARGIDIDELTHVINYEIPNIPETYVHRIGRTGRAGNSGVAWSFVDREEVPFLRDIQKLIKQDIPVVAEHPFLPGTHVAEANDAKPFYNDGNNGNQRVARKKENLRKEGKSAAPARRDSNFSAPARNDRRDQPANDAPKPKPKTEGPPKPFTRFKPRD
jgi:ATP-dependent RNA helicase RhlE